MVLHRPVLAEKGSYIWERRIIGLTADGRSEDVKSTKQARRAPVKWQDLSQMVRNSRPWKTELLLVT